MDEFVAILNIGLTQLLFAHCRNIRSIDHYVIDTQIRQSLVYLEAAEIGFINWEVCGTKIIAYPIFV